MILSRPASPDVFGTVALNAGVTLYDARFRRVAAADARDPLVQRLAAGVAGLNPMQKIAGIQAAVGRQVRWAHDLDNLGVADYWDNASDTLRRGSGDAEDIAIVKMQALKAAGFDPKDLYISIGRHAQRGAHIMLLVRTAGGFVAMDDKDAGPMGAGQRSKFTPIMTVGQGMSWIHGRRISGGNRIASASGTKSTAR
jgi:predicted transglutaminase-like cysteine proteinase